MTLLLSICLPVLITTTLVPGVKQVDANRTNVSAGMVPGFAPTDGHGSRRGSKPFDDDDGGGGGWLPFASMVKAPNVVDDALLQLGLYRSSANDAKDEPAEGSTSLLLATNAFSRWWGRMADIIRQFANGCSISFVTPSHSSVSASTLS